MKIDAQPIQNGSEPSKTISVDVSLLKPPAAGQCNVPIDQIMSAVNSVKGYVVSRLARIGRTCDVDDLMQDIRVAVWDGVTKGRYRELPGIPFEAWVQGVCNKICAAHVRRELSHQTLPLLMDFTTAEVSPEVFAVVGAGLGLDSVERYVDHAWAQAMLSLVQRNVKEDTWQLAVSSLVGPRHYGPPSPRDRRRWHAVTVVRQTAMTISAALNCHPEPGLSMEGLCRCAADCLPTAVLRRVAETIVRPGLRGLPRSVQMAALATELGVTERYVAVNIGFARQLYRTAWRVLQHEANRQPG
ncbi:hypothetical protein [Pseudarthrobacter niigatensis]|uniref:RNA polymerase sigma-70 region 2 domain-containing protein n=1 Tax=Pseudarthrobacter niigatensis TaxID=369935 RepID=A0AAJ1SUP8_9MICC|nr:hypothetical protein [Pseudarthrobacter niigatensis]MDQ0144708.1 hypothetical protein [Pseudarthrobacter niigatensis]MDQ0265354.1 hypothetical protein [Pseudarthrobacter niigatensis]